MPDIAIIGDVHLQFVEEDVEYFNASLYDLLIFVGDLAGYLASRTRDVAHLISQLEKPTLFIPGNHDSTNVFQLIAEVAHSSVLALVFGQGQTTQVSRLKKQLSSVDFCGYSLHPFTLGGHTFDIIAGRPHSMGGPTLSFKPYLKRQFGIDTLEASAKLIMQRVDESTATDIVFLSHNGPYGLGTEPDDIWGCDFNEELGDFGDPDLALAIDYARAQGKRVLAVIAGHMHHRTKKGEYRRWYIHQDDTHYINAARVPRIYRSGGKTLRHHIRLSMTQSGITVSPVVIP